MNAEQRISVRVPTDIKKRLADAEAATGLPQSVIVKECVKAFLEEVEAKGSITLPLKIADSVKSPPIKFQE